jgi:amino acid transporter
VIVSFTILCFLNGFSTFWSVNEPSFASSFLTAYVGIPLFAAFYFGHRLYARQDGWARKPEEVDLQTGLSELIAEEKPQRVFKGLEKIKYIWE